MARSNFKMSYSVTADLSFSSKTAAERYLKEEEELWSSFLKETSEFNSGPLQSSFGGQISMNSLSSAFETIRETLGDERRFNQLSHRPPSTFCLPPPSSTLEGQLILGLFENERKGDAFSVYIWFVAQNAHVDRQQERNLQDMIERGATLRTAAVASSVLPFNRISSQKIASAARKAENQVEALNIEVSKADEINSTHEEALSEFRSDLSERAHRVTRIVAKRERLRRQRLSCSLFVGQFPA